MNKVSVRCYGEC